MKKLCKSSMTHINEEVSSTRRAIVNHREELDQGNDVKMTANIRNKITPLESACMKLKKSGSVPYYNSAWEICLKREDKEEQEIIVNTMKDKKRAWKASLVATLFPGVSQTSAMQKMSVERLQQRLDSVCRVDLTADEMKALYRALNR